MIAMSTAEQRQPRHGRDVVDQYMPMVRRIAIRTTRTLPSSVSFDDVLSAGWVGMAEALSRRTPDMDDEHFQAYASYRVRGAILDYLRGLDPLSRKLRNASRKISETAAELSTRLGRMPEEEEVAAELGLTLEKYHALLGEISEAGYARLSLTGAEQSEAPLPEFIASRAELIEEVSKITTSLPERLQVVLALYYQEQCSFREIGEVLGVTESRVCQLHSEAVHLIRARLDRPRPRR